MHLENGAALNTWLARILPSLCSADPKILSKYIVALICKNKPEEYLKQSCLSQLRIFLTDSTNNFVEELFRVLKTKEYIGTANDVNKQIDINIVNERNSCENNSSTNDVNICENVQMLTENSQWKSSRLSNSKERCKDFEEVGFCLLGDCCPYDHGLHPLTVEDIKPKGSESTNNLHKLKQIQSLVSPGNNGHNARSLQDNLSDCYNPESPFVEKQQNKPDHRNIITIVNPTTCENLANGTGRWTLPKSDNDNKYPARRRRSTSLVNSKHNRMGCTLKVANVPESKNNIATLYEYFSKFGTVVNVDISFDGNPKSALVAFSKLSDAQSALNSPNSILDVDTIGACLFDINDISTNRAKRRSNSCEGNRVHAAVPYNSFVNPGVFKTVHNIKPTICSPADKATTLQYQILDELLVKQRALVSLLDSAKSSDEKRTIAKALKEVAAVVAKQNDYIKSAILKRKRPRPHHDPYDYPLYEPSRYKYIRPELNECTIAVSQVPPNLIESLEMFFRELHVKDVYRGRHNEVIATFASRHQAEAVITQGIRLRDQYLLASWHSPDSSYAMTASSILKPPDMPNSKNGEADNCYVTVDKNAPEYDRVANWLSTLHDATNNEEMKRQATSSHNKAAVEL
ncbi:hypothetical protein GJ496_005660 [Pomphorhynchus laevis]|nr:hypothetical protein GJ496_005660 [Pomphorhynchus laevis]